MELEELIKEIQKYVICSGLTDDECYKYSIDCNDCPFKHITITKLLPDILKYLERLNFEAKRLEELRDLRKAFDLACEVSAFSCCEDVFTHDCDNDCANHWKEYFIQKARENNENT